MLRDEYFNLALSSPHLATVSGSIWIVRSNHCCVITLEHTLAWYIFSSDDFERTQKQTLQKKPLDFMLYKKWYRQQLAVIELPCLLLLHLLHIQNAQCSWWLILCRSACKATEICKINSRLAQWQRNLSVTLHDVWSHSGWNEAQGGRIDEGKHPNLPA